MRLSAMSVAVGLMSAAFSLTSVAATVGLATPPAMAEEPRRLPAAAANALWSPAAIAELAAEARAAAAEGLDPAAYDIAGLEAAAGGSDTAEADRRATELAVMLADHYANGVVADRTRFDWLIASPRADRDRLSAGLAGAIRAGRVRPWLRGLLPADARYAALRKAYGETTDVALRDRLRVNLERWRWMPRTLGADHIYVNVPSYTLSVVDDGRSVSSYTVVVGAPQTPTPQISMTASAIVVNPWWNVPESIARKGMGRGFQAVSAGGGVRYRQAPGPRNALGKIKIDMPNPHAIYLHDTPSKALFARDSRAFSHGCIRVKDIDRLALELAEHDGGPAAEVRRGIAGSATRTLPLASRRPVYLVYFTADVDASGKLVTLEDPYARDPRLLDALRRAEQFAAAKHGRAMRA